VRPVLVEQYYGILRLTMELVGTVPQAARE
jgi:hypothetical protein